MVGNQMDGQYDLLHMDCEAARSSISARVDGELPTPLEPQLDLDLDDCAGCQAWEERAFALRRSVAMRQPPMPADLNTRLIARLGVPDPGAGQWVRYALGVVAATITILNLPLLLGLSSNTAGHDSRHLGTFGVALGVGLLWAALRPERANGLVPLAAALAGATMIGAFVDLASGEATALAESSHVLELIGLALLWHLSGGRRTLTRRLRSLRSSHALGPA